MPIIKNYLRYLLEILTQYGEHTDPSVYERRTKLVQTWCCNWTDVHTCSPPHKLYFYHNLLLLCILYLYIYLYIYTYIGANENLLRFTDLLLPHMCTLNKINMNLCSVPYLKKFLPQKCFHQPIILTVIVSCSSVKSDFMSKMSAFL